MKKIYIIPSLLLIIILFSSCSKTLLISQGEHGYAGELGDNYEITTLNTVSSSGSSFFGFGNGSRSEDGIVTNFFGSDVNYKQSNFLRVLTFLVYSAIDNLLKGASGQAIQNMNLIFGYEETEGLHLKGTAF